tara:strand:+ start:780 stop:1565 length:786 start_codon:yes stop_codon:yes gene_type:complete
MPGYNTNGDNYGGMDGFGNPRGDNGKRGDQVEKTVYDKPDTAEYLDNLLGPSPNLEKAKKAQDDRFNPDKNKGIFSNFKMPTFDQVYNTTGQLLSLDPMMQFGLKALNIANFNPKKNLETNEIKTSLVGDLGTATFGKLNFDNYEGLTDKEGFYNAGLTFDEKGNFTGTDFDALANEVAKQGGTYTGPSMDNFGDDNKGGNNPLADQLAQQTKLQNELAAREEAERNLFDDPGKLEMYKDYLQQGYPADLAKYLVDGLYGV